MVLDSSTVGVQGRRLSRVGRLKESRETPRETPARLTLLFRFCCLTGACGFEGFL